MSSIVEEDIEEMDGETIESEEFIVKAKGFSYDASATDLCQFFAGCDIKGGKRKGIHFIYSRPGKSNEAYIEFYERDDLKKALGFNKKFIGDRYVDVSSATREMMENALADSVGGTGDATDNNTIVKLSGMPFTALHDDIATFFAGCDISGGKKRGISFLRNTDGSAAGACFVEFLTSEDVKLALAKDKQYMGSRFCHVTRVTADTREEELSKQMQVLQDLKEPIVKLKGLPFKATEDDIRNFFPDLEIVAMEMVLNDQGNCRGEAFVDFASVDDAKEALKCYKLKLLHRYVDVTKSSKAEWISMLPTTEKIAKTAEDLEEPIVRLNNLPAKVTKGEIEDFLFGLECRAIQVVQLPRGDCNGEAFVELLTLEDAAQALEKHKKPLNGESGRDRKVDVVASSKCDWRKTPLQKAAQKPESRKRSRSPVHVSHSRKRALPTEQSDRGRFSATPRLDAAVGYPALFNQGYQSGYNERSVQEFLVNMVGLPFTASEEDVKQFFHPIKITQIEFLKNERGQPRGIAVVGFYSEDDRGNAMLRNKNTIGSRYVNLHKRNEPREYDFDFTKGAKGRGDSSSKRDSYSDMRMSRHSPPRDTYRDSRRDTYSRY